MDGLIRQDRSRLDFDLGAIFDEGGDLHGGHRGKILSHDAAVDLPDLGQAIDVFALVDEVPDEVRDVLRPRAFAGEDGSDVTQRRAICATRSSLSNRPSAFQPTWPARKIVRPRATTPLA